MTHRANLHDGIGDAEATSDGKLNRIYVPSIAYASVPADGTAGFNAGCECIVDNGAAGADFYINQGSSTSCLFRAVLAGFISQQSFVIPLSEMRAATTMGILGNTAGTPSGALGITPGTFGTALPVLVGEAGASKTDVARFQFQIPWNFNPGGVITFVANAQEATATDGTLAINAYATAAGSNLGGSMSGTMGSSASNFTKAITTTGLVGGQVLDCEISAVTVTSGTITINSISALVDLLT